LRIVLDTAILSRAHPLATGPARALLELILERGDVLIMTESILAELDRAMRYPRMVKHSGLSPREITEYVASVKRSTDMLTIFSAPIPPISDPDDVHVIQAAICGKADFLCTLDKHFFEEPVPDFCADRGITVITDIDLLKKVRQ
jgi:putative PIN family toxin of toxin-antitoxin system